MRTQLIMALMLLSSIANAQLQTLADTYNSLFWLVADEGVYNEDGEEAQAGDKIAAWHDLSSNGFVFENNSSSSQPTLALDGQNLFVDFNENTYLSDNNVNDVLNGQTEFSIAFIVKTDEIDEDFNILSIKTNNKADKHFFVRYEYTGENAERKHSIQAGLKSNSSDKQIVTAELENISDYQIIVITWNSGDHLKLYVNNALADISESKITGNLSNVNSLYLGELTSSKKRSGEQTLGSGGGLSGVVFLNESLSGSEVANLSGELPIELTSFHGTANVTSNILEWATAVEINNDYFTLEKSANGSTFSTLKTIDGAGNSNLSNTYSIADFNPYNITYYRLKQTDFDGKYEYSNIIAVTNDMINELVTVYPNPASDVINIDVTDLAYTVSIFNMYNSIVYQETNVDFIELNSFSRGSYIIEIKNTHGDRIYQNKIVLH